MRVASQVHPATPPPETGRRPAPLRLLVLLAVTLGVLTACGDDGENGASATTAPDGTTTTADDSDGTTTTTQEEPDPSDVTTLSVYFLDTEGEIRVGHVRETESAGVAEAALEELFAGPGPEDEALGLSSAVPDGTELRSIDLAGGVATVDVTEEFTSGGGSLSMQGRLAQVVYTTTQFPTVEAVELLVEGEVVEALGGEGVVIDGPVTRADFRFQGTYETLEPTVLVETPRPGEEVEGEEVTVTGSSTTFEAALYFQLLDADGEVVMPETYAMATSGTGMTGTFEETFEIPDEVSGDFTVRVYDISAESGAPVGVTEVPVTRAS